MKLLRLVLIAGLVYVWRLVDARLHGETPGLEQFWTLAVVFIAGYLLGGMDKAEAAKRPYERMAFGILAGLGLGLLFLVLGLLSEIARLFTPYPATGWNFLWAVLWHTAFGVIGGFIVAFVRPLEFTGDRPWSLKPEK